MATKHGTHNRPNYTGETIDVRVTDDLEDRRNLCRFVAARTAYGRGAVAPGGQAFGSLVVGADANYLRNLGGFGMTGFDEDQYARDRPGIAALVDGWIAWFRTARTR